MKLMIAADGSPFQRGVQGAQLAEISSLPTAAGQSAWEALETGACSLMHPNRLCPKSG